MSIAIDCPGCQMGNHDNHDPKWGIIEDCIGGQHCACTGDCNERFNLANAEFKAWWETLQEVEW